MRRPASTPGAVSAAALASMRVMWLSLLRDRAALALIFVLPVVIFSLFAAIFAGASGDRVRIHLGLADLARTATTGRLAAALVADPALRVEAAGFATPAAAAEAVRRGSIDAALVLRGELSAPPAGEAEPAPPVLLIENPARALAVPIVLGQVQRALGQALPDVLLSRMVADVERSGKIGAEERAFLDEAFAEQRAKREPFSFTALVARENTAADRGDGHDARIVYYAGAIAAVFLLFSAMQGALSLVDERESALADRLAASPGGLPAVVLGKFLFLLLQGVAQAGLIFLAAGLFHGVAIGPHAPVWLATSVFVSAMAAGLALAVCALARTRQQAQLGATFGVLLLSAVGGSMVPRFLMPPWLQQAGWFTPNAWAIEAYQRGLGEGALAALPAWGVLGALALAGLGIAAAAVLRAGPGRG